MNKKIKLVLSLFVLFIFILEIGCQKQSPDWKGTIKKVGKEPLRKKMA